MALAPCLDVGKIREKENGGEKIGKKIRLSPVWLQEKIGKRRIRKEIFGGSIPVF